MELVEKVAPLDKKIMIPEELRMRAELTLNQDPAVELDKKFPMEAKEINTEALSRLILDIDQPVD